MNNGYDIAIVGGGVIGFALARDLLKEGARIAVIDAGAEIPAATVAAAGMLAPSFERVSAASEALYDFSAASLDAWPDFARALEEETGVDVDYRGDGMFGVAFDRKILRKLQTDCEILKSRGANVEMISGEEARRMEPALSPEIIGAMHALRDAQVDPRKLLTALRGSVEKNGGRLLSGRVERIEQEKSGVALRLARGERIEAERAVIASGAAACFADGLFPPPVFPVKGEAASYAMPEGAFKRVIRAPGAYLCPKAGGRLVIGATEYEGRCDLEVDADAIAGLKNNGAAAVPAIAGWREQERWAGLRPGTPDGAPILGRDARGPDNVFLALGHYRNGILLAPASARALADDIVGRAPVTDLKPFRPDRFGEKEARRHG